LRLLWATILAALVGGAAMAQECSPNTVYLRGDWGQVRFAVELADNNRERARGLMFRDSMPESQGMLFVYPFPGPVAFWMKNTLIPLDMVFADESGVVQRVHHHAIPGDETLIWGGKRIQYVLEVNAGIAGALGITEGSQLRHPAVKQGGAVWPC